MAGIITPETFDKALREAVSSRIHEIISEETGSTVARIEQRVRDEADALALRLLSYYDVYRDQRGIVITVRKEPE